MAPSIQRLIKEKKYPFIFSFLVLLICVSVLLLNNNRYPYLSTTDLENSQSISSSPEKKSNPQISNPNKDKPDFDNSDSNEISNGVESNWEVCKGPMAADFIPCLDNMKAVKALKSRRHMEHRERYCPKPSPRCLVPLPQGYKIPVPWPRSRDMVRFIRRLLRSGGLKPLIWFDNGPHPKLVEYKKDQNWVLKSGDYLVFPGGGTQFKEGVTKYIEFIEKAHVVEIVKLLHFSMYWFLSKKQKTVGAGLFITCQTLPIIEWGKHTRVILDVGCGVASFGGYLLEKGVIAMSFAPKDEHEAQIQFALERGIPATLSVIGTKRLTFPDNVYDLIHCARCRVHWDADGGKPLLELNRILRPGGFFVWSATPVYRDDERDQNVWNAMVAVTESICWKVVAKTVDSSGIGLVIYQKPFSNSCYEERKENNPPLCDRRDKQNSSWYVPLGSCLPHLPVAGLDDEHNWPTPWPERLSSKPSSLSTKPSAEEIFYEDTKHWSALVSDVYLDSLTINWLSIRNVMDMNAGYGGGESREWAYRMDALGAFKWKRSISWKTSHFQSCSSQENSVELTPVPYMDQLFAAALIGQPLWVMNVVPVDVPDTLSVIFDRGLIGIYHDWCEALNTYPRTYDLLHSSFLFRNLTQRCDIVDVAVEMDRILRPGGWVLVRDTTEMISKISPILRSLHWDITLYKEQFLVGKKVFWRPTDGESQT
ncbi:hypothetical protein HHK36_016133 [Tetracentron sinense]|uniref:Methyltransferase n=1 Tax=Tetracentron sinense TaxID=13715 RepID=A0A834Z2Z0_TETSI|nr:hypothetical protein HHK36_016133 [Tetracentron sinense]